MKTIEKVITNGDIQELVATSAAKSLADMMEQYSKAIVNHMAYPPFFNGTEHHFDPFTKYTKVRIEVDPELIDHKFQNAFYKQLTSAINKQHITTFNNALFCEYNFHNDGCIDALLGFSPVEGAMESLGYISGIGTAIQRKLEDEIAIIIAKIFDRYNDSVKNKREPIYKGRLELYVYSNTFEYLVDNEITNMEYLITHTNCLSMMINSIINRMNVEGVTIEIDGYDDHNVKYEIKPIGVQTLPEKIEYDITEFIDED